LQTLTVRDSSFYANLHLDVELDAAVFKNAFEHGQRINIGLNNGVTPDEAVRAASEAKKDEKVETKETDEDKEGKADATPEEEKKEKKEDA